LQKCIRKGGEKKKKKKPKDVDRGEEGGGGGGGERRRGGGVYRVLTGKGGKRYDTGADPFYEIFHTDILKSLD